MKALVVGCGSIGSRHARLLKETGFSVWGVSKRQINGMDTYRTITDALDHVSPDYVIVASETAKHYAALAELARLDFKGLVLVEKPLFAGTEDIPPNTFRGLFAGYNLRFHPVIQKLRQTLASEKIISVHIYVGQYLPEWRPDTDYRDTYSSRKDQGGGVLRDLSHELDYTTWLFGEWTSMTAVGGHFSCLEIDSDDVFSILMTSAKCPVVSIHLNYLDRVARREILVNTDQHTIRADLIQATLTVDNQSASFPLSRDYTYEAQHKAIIAGDWESLCSGQDGIKVLKMIAAAEKAAQKKGWVTNG